MGSGGARGVCEQGGSGVELELVMEVSYCASESHPVKEIKVVYVFSIFLLKMLCL